MRQPYYPLIRELLRVAELGRDWDSYGAPPVDPDAVYSAIRLVADFAKLTSPVPFPDVGPTPDGGVLLRWDLGATEVDVVYHGDRGRYVITRLADDQILAQGELDDVDPLKEVVGRFVVGAA